MAEDGSKTVVVGVGGGIAAYKAGELIRRLRDHRLRVRVAMTAMAARFVTPLTFQALSGEPVLADLADPAQDSAYGHLALARAASALVVAPATADLIARLAHGLADDAVTTTALAMSGPILVCPAMNPAMWESPPVRANLEQLQRDPRVTLLGPASGLLADGDRGIGRLAEVPDIVAATLQLLGPGDLLGKKILITAGPTHEPLDPTRFLSNPASGKMGYALAAAARRRGAAVVLVSGPVGLPAPAGVELRQVTTAEQMLAACRSALPGCAAVIASAAVSDFRPAVYSPQKIKKGGATSSLSLVATPDVLLELSRAAESPRPCFVGFAAETDNLLAQGREKLLAKRLDWVVANLVGRPGIGFGSDENEVLLVSAAGAEPLPRQSKAALAERILDRIAAGWR